jgi:hypothetical protein
MSVVGLAQPSRPRVAPPCSRRRRAGQGARVTLMSRRPLTTWSAPPEFFRDFLNSYLVDAPQGWRAALERTRASVFNDQNFQATWRQLLPADKSVLRLLRVGASIGSGEAAQFSEVRCDQLPKRSFIFRYRRPRADAHDRPRDSSLGSGSRHSPSATELTFESKGRRWQQAAMPTVVERRLLGH